MAVLCDHLGILHQYAVPQHFTVNEPEYVDVSHTMPQHFSQK